MLPDLVTVRFMLDADADAGVLPRLLQPFARRDVVPERMWSHRTGNTLHVEIAVHEVEAGLAHQIEGNLRQVVGVREVVRVQPELRLAA